jgi:hypothetical protein
MPGKTEAHVTPRDRFDVLILVARPAAGKSEVIDYLARTSPAERVRRFHIGGLHQIDDFPMLWAWFEEDAILREMGLPALHTDAEGSFAFRELWDVLIRRMCLEYRKLLSEDRDSLGRSTALIEFSRGSEHGGYAQAFAAFEPDVLRRAAILSIDVSWEESLRKNRRRFNPDRPHSILEHGLSDEKLEKLYRENDWAAFTAADPSFVSPQGIRVPYAVMPNEDDVTTPRGEALGERLEQSLSRLWDLYTKR